MANLKISQLGAAAALTGAELVELVQGGVNVQSTAQAIADLTSGVTDGDKGDITVSSSGAVWTLDNTAVTPASYTNTNLTVDSKGRITAASDGTVAAPAGSNGQIQINNAGAFGAAATTYYDTATGWLGLGTVTPRGALDVTGENTYIQPQTTGLATNDIYASFQQYRQTPNGVGLKLVDPTYDPTGQNVFKYSVGRLGMGTGSISNGLINSKIEFRGNSIYIDSLTSSGRGVFFGENDSTNNNFLRLEHDSDNGSGDEYRFFTGKISNATDRPRLNLSAQGFRFYSGVDGTDAHANPLVIDITSTGQTTIQTPTSSVIAMIIKGATSQSSDLHQWQDSSATVLSRVKSNGDIEVPDEAYGAGWDGNTEVPTKNAVYDKIQSLSAGGITRSINVISTPTTAGAAASTDYVYFVSGTTTLTLPTAVGNTNTYSVKRTGVNTVTIDTTSAQTIDGALTQTLLTQYESMTFVSDGANWGVI